MSYVRLLIARASTYGIKVRERAREDSTEHHQILRQILDEFKNPIMQMSDQISIIHDTFNSKTYSIYVLYSLILISCQEKSGKECSAGCRRSSTEATMRTCLKAYFMIPGDGYSTARTLLNGVNRVCLLFSGSTAYVRNHAVIQGI